MTCNTCRQPFRIVVIHAIGEGREWVGPVVEEFWKTDVDIGAPIRQNLEKAAANGNFVEKYKECGVMTLLRQPMSLRPCGPFGYRPHTLEIRQNANPIRSCLTFFSLLAQPMKAVSVIETWILLISSSRLGGCDQINDNHVPLVHDVNHPTESHSFLGRFMHTSSPFLKFIASSSVWTMSTGQDNMFLWSRPGRVTNYVCI